ncbi:phosphoribosylamine--glycine ligase [Desulfohalotomaculum tongense]|uniref:phosphoribosylamine--glycine ligase n=1 Tax=Desulforadius tongensis TaxID=1216062 RepID=UPI00195A1C53|nr:phosphoribosylamine--glycine ligase [Desulforadius tongensis]MBM7854259.1 phosphoribosylamine--glycine ligase [Desulforadius tongensis]
MKVLVVGGGGREHALVWKIAQSPKVDKIYCAPGNAGIAQLAACVDIKAGDVDALLKFAVKENIHLTVVGPEAPLIEGIVDKFNRAGLRIFGPGRDAAQLEGSKALAKHFMAEYGIPTARYAAFHDAKEAMDHVREKNCPLVVKASGLAAGKGVIVCEYVADALDAVRRVMVDKEFGAAGTQVVIEERLEGEEVSVLAFTDGKTIVPMVPSQDHKRVFDNDRGPNTGGMGAYAPAPLYTPELHQRVVKEILEPTIKGMAEQGWSYKGVIYAGLMVTKDGPKVLEYNVRFGDPETQPVLSLLDTDLVEIMEAVIDERLDQIEVKWKKGASVCVVMSAPGYPGSYPKGDVITGLDKVPREVVVFHAGTAVKEGEIVTSGGRVLGVTAVGSDISDAVEKAYHGVEQINFNGAHYRKDIGAKAIKS